MKKIILSILLALSALAFALPTQAAFGDALRQFYSGTVEQVYRPPAEGIEATLPRAVGNVISVVLGFVGVILLVIVVYAGFLWLTAAGNQDQVVKAKKLLRNGIIGLLITLGAFVITSFVVLALDSALRSSTRGGLSQLISPVFNRFS